VVDRLRLRLVEALQWTASQNNTEALWATVRQQAQDMLQVDWRDGELVGSTAAQAFDVRCDRSTMTQSDIDNGCLTVIVGVATVRPAEFTIFEITQQVKQPEIGRRRRRFPFALRRLRFR
jgi:phage tail sheath protein FI